MSMTKAVPKPTLMGAGMTAKTFPNSNLTGKNTAGPHPTAPCVGCSKATKPIPAPKAM